MDALEFIKERQRLCSCYECKECPLIKEGCSFAESEAESLVNRVEKWSRENPIVTNEMMFKRVFGRDLDMVYINDSNGSVFCCIDRRELNNRKDIEKWLNEPYKEPKGET